MKIGHIISKLRYDKGYNQIEMAEKLGVTKQQRLEEKNGIH